MLRDHYNQSLNLCKNCGSEIPYEKRNNKFCSKRCSVTFNNTGRVKSPETKRKISERIKTLNPPGSRKGKITAKICKIQWQVCSVCSNSFYTRGWSKYYKRSTCGKRECLIHASVGNRTYVNGRRKLFRYFNQFQNEEVLLESSWEHELAIWLDEREIKWIRPKPIKWFDESTNKDRLYYPDFYLVDFSLYLDPKNPTALSLSREKMATVSKLIPLVYGSLDKIKSAVLSL